MAWWRDAKFGMFIHWGLYSAAEGRWDGEAFPAMRPGFEWLMAKGRPGGIDQEEYVATLAPRMTLENFRPEEWAARARRAGMKYFVITAKHHDGFGMVDFPNTEYDIASTTPYGKDPMPALAEAVRREGLRFGFYFSQSQDWSKPGGRPDWFKGLEGDWNHYVREHAVPQLRHLLSGAYGVIDILWFDSGRTTKTREGAHLIWNELSAMPSILVNNRLKVDNLGDFETPEQWIPPTVQTNSPWETCMTLNGSWGYNPTDPEWATSVELIRNLCRVVSRGGNYLLNVGPKADGSWEPQVDERLDAIGRWMDVNQGSIYGTRPDPCGPVRWGTLTWKRAGSDSILFAHIFDFPENGKLLIPITNRLKAAHWLGGKPFSKPWKISEDGLVLDIHKEPVLHDAASVLVLNLEGQPMPLPLVAQPEADGSIQLLSTEATCDGGVHHHYREPVLDGWIPSDPLSTATWRFRVPEEGGVYNLEALYGFHSSGGPEGRFMMASVAGMEKVLPVRVTGIKPDARNPENNRLVMDRIEADSGDLELKGGLHELVLGVEDSGTPIPKITKEQKNNLCYSEFPMVELLRLVPASKPY